MCKGYILPEFDIWLQEMAGDAQQVEQQGDGQLQHDGGAGQVQCQEQLFQEYGDMKKGYSEIRDGEEGQGGRARREIERLERDAAVQKSARFVKPRVGTGIQRDGLIQI